MNGALRVKEIQKLGKMSQNLSSAAVVIGTLRVKYPMLSAECIKAPELDDYVPKIFSANNASCSMANLMTLTSLRSRVP